MARRPYYYIIMRKLFAIATFIGVGVLSLFSMSQIVSASDGTVASSSYSSVYGGSVKISGDGTLVYCFYNSGLFMSGANPVFSPAYTPFYFTGDSPNLDFAPTPDGIYRIDYFANSTFSSCSLSPLGSLEFSFAGGVFESYNTSTRVVSVDTPVNYSATSTSVTFSGSYYLSSEDAQYPPDQWDFAPKLRLFISDQANGTTSLILNFPINVLDSVVSFSTTTTLLDNYRYAWTLDIRGNNNEPLGSGKFPDGSSFWQFTTGSFDPTFGQNYDLSACNVLVGFDAGTCLYNLIMPNEPVFASQFKEAQFVYGRAFPMGYVTRLLEILVSSSTSSLPVISATVPSGVIGSGATISLDVNNALDFILDADVDSFGTSTSTFYDTTSYYWNIIVYVALGFYIIRRIIGSHLIPYKLS